MGFTQKKMLAKLGYRFDGNDLTQFEAECYTIIENRFAELNHREQKKASKKVR